MGKGINPAFVYRGAGRVCCAIIFYDGLFHFLHVFCCLIGDADDHEVVFKFFCNFVQVGNFLHAPVAPGAPEIDENELTRGVRDFGYPFFDDNRRHFLVDEFFVCTGIFPVVGFLRLSGNAYAGSHAK